MCLQQRCSPGTKVYGGRTYFLYSFTGKVYSTATMSTKAIIAGDSRIRDFKLLPVQNEHLYHTHVESMRGGGVQRITNKVLDIIQGYSENDVIFVYLLRGICDIHRNGNI